MRKPLIAVAAAALSVASLAGCKLEVQPVPSDTPSNSGATTINGNGETVFSLVDTRLGTYRSAGSAEAGVACEWTLFEDDNNDTGNEQQVRLEGNNLVPDDTIDTDPVAAGVQGDAGIALDVDSDEVQTFKLQKGDARLVAKGCKTFERIGD